MNVEILKVNSKEMALEANKYLTKLIHDEKKYDKNINEKCVVNSLYDNFYMNENVCILLAKEEKQYVGYLFGTVMDAGDAYINTQAKLDAMFVDEKYRGNKIGKKLIDDFKKWTNKKSVKYIELTVCNDNFFAINLYKNSGFKDVKIVMQCTVKEQKIE